MIACKNLIQDCYLMTNRIGHKKLTIIKMCTHHHVEWLKFFYVTQFQLHKFYNHLSIYMYSTYHMSQSLKYFPNQ